MDQERLLFSRTLSFYWSFIGEIPAIVTNCLCYLWSSPYTVGKVGVSWVANMEFGAIEPDSAIKTVVLGC